MVKSEAKMGVQDGAEVEERRQKVEYREGKRGGERDHASFQFCLQRFCFFPFSGH